MIFFLSSLYTVLTATIVIQGFLEQRPQLSTAFQVQPHHFRNSHSKFDENKTLFSYNDNNLFAITSSQHIRQGDVDGDDIFGYNRALFIPDEIITTSNASIERLSRVRDALDCLGTASILTIEYDIQLTSVWPYGLRTYCMEIGTLALVHDPIVDIENSRIVINALLATGCHPEYDKITWVYKNASSLYAYVDKLVEYCNRPASPFINECNEYDTDIVLGIEPGSITDNTEWISLKTDFDCASQDSISITQQMTIPQLNRSVSTSGIVNGSDYAQILTKTGFGFELFSSSALIRNLIISTTIVFPPLEYKDDPTTTQDIITPTFTTVFINNTQMNMTNTTSNSLFTSTQGLPSATQMPLSLDNNKNDVTVLILTIVVIIMTIGYIGGGILIYYKVKQRSPINNVTNTEDIQMNRRGDGSLRDSNYAILELASPNVQAGYPNQLVKKTAYKETSLVLNMI